MQTKLEHMIEVVMAEQGVSLLQAQIIIRDVLGDAVDETRKKYTKGE